MDDAKVEAVLVALGAHLEWEQWRQGLLKLPPAVTALGNDCVYMIQQCRAWLFLIRYEIAHIQKTGTYYPRRYKALPEAKAACERHHAMGKWE